MNRLNTVKEKAQHLVRNPTELFNSQRRVIQRKFRKVVTGDEKKRIRDLLKEKKKEPTNTKLFDKISFSLGVVNIPVCQFFMLNRPDLFWAWFTFIIPTLLIARLYFYRKIKQQYFLYDFCYFTNILSVVTMHTYDVLPSLFRVVFIFCNGPLAWAVVIWRNSLVYHDFDRMTSIYIHILPAMLSYCVRWYGLSRENAAANLTSMDFVKAALVYLFWQYLYYYKTEVVDKKYLDANPEIVTSLRYIATDKKNGMAQAVLVFCRFLGIYEKTEEYNPAEFKTLMVFMTTQFLYTIVTMLPVPFVYQSIHLQAALIAGVFICVVYNGASYYIEVFSKRYQLKFAKKEDMQMVVQAAAEIAYEATKSATSSAGNGSPNPQSKSSPKKMLSPGRHGGRGSLGLGLARANRSMGMGGGSCSVLSGADVDPPAASGYSESGDCGDSNCVPDAGDEGEEVGAGLDTASVEDEVEGVDEERERSKSEDVRYIIRAATTVFVDEWHRTEGVSGGHSSGDEGGDDESLDESLLSYRSSNFSDDEDESEAGNEEEKDKDA